MYTLFLVLNSVKSNFLSSLFSIDSDTDNERSTFLTDQTKYGSSLLGFDPQLDSILDNEWIVFGKETCSFTKKAIHVLKKHGNDPFFVDMEKQMKELYEKLKKLLGHDTLPLIIHEKKFFGGYTQVLQFYNEKDSNQKPDEQLSEVDKFYKDYYKKNYENDLRSI